MFRANRKLVECLAQHPKADLKLRDNFGCGAVDMLDYTTDEFIFDTIIHATYPDIAHELEEHGMDEKKQQENIVPFKPKFD